MIEKLSTFMSLKLMNGAFHFTYTNGSEVPHISMHDSVDICDCVWAYYAWLSPYDYSIWHRVGQDTEMYVCVFVQLSS